jgi:hypothetical protein
MEAPKCKLCGYRHYGLCAAPVEEEPIPVVPYVQPPPMPIEQPVQPIQAPSKPDRRTYMRDYMRRRRQAEKVGAPMPTIEKPHFDRAAYQREYMRQRAAMKKGQ